MAQKTVAVVGGGVAGAAAALELARAGARVELVEQDDYLGGHAARLACKALEDCQGCNGCLAESRLREVLEHPGVRIRRRSTLTALEGGPGAFRLRLSQRPAYIDPRTCTGCGVCLERCPEEGALRGPLLAGDLPRLAVDPAVCLYFSDGGAALCQDACPEEAMDFGQQPAEVELEAQAVVLATGFAPYPAEAKRRLGYGEVPDVITALELEDRLRRQGKALRPSDGREPDRVAFLQCVGSRERQGHNYCSRVCCGYALRLGRTLASRFGARVTVFYMDLQSFGHAPDELLAAARRELELVRCLPYDALAGGGGGVRLAYQPPGESGLCEREFDLLVLSVGITPGTESARLAGLAGLELDGHGFLPAAGGNGVFVAGAAGRPMDVAETIASAGAAAGQALRYLEETA
jgi:heterodisulfide reductase subunit A